MNYRDLCGRMSIAGWTSHPLIGAQFRKRRLDAALRATHTYKEYIAGAPPPLFQQSGSYVARLAYTDAKGAHSDVIHVNPRQGILLHIHSGTGRKTVGYLRDVVA